MLNSINNSVNQRSYSTPLSFKGSINIEKLGKEEFKAITSSLDGKDLNAVKKVLKHLKSWSLRLKFAIQAPKNEVINVGIKEQPGPWGGEYTTGITLEYNAKNGNATLDIDNNELRLIGLGYKDKFKEVCQRCDRFVNNVIQDCKPKKTLKINTIEPPTKEQFKAVHSKYFKG